MGVSRNGNGISGLVGTRNGNGAASEMRVQGLDSNGVEELQRAYRDGYREMLGFAYKRVDSLHDAHDIVQQAVVNALSSLERGAKIENMNGFLHRCVHNLCIDYSYRILDIPLESEDESCIKTEKSSATTMGIREQFREVEDAVRKMTPPQRHAFLLTDIHGYSYRDVANRMDRSIESVRQLLNRARQNIRTAVDRGQDWAECAVPAYGLNRSLVSKQIGSTANASDWAREKVFAVQSWLSSNFYSGLDGLVQPSAAIITGVAVVATVVLTPPPTLPSEHGKEGIGPVKKIAHGSERGISRPEWNVKTNTKHSGLHDAGRQSLRESKAPPLSTYHFDGDKRVITDRSALSATNDGGSRGSQKKQGSGDSDQIPVASPELELKPGDPVEMDEISISKSLKKDQGIDQARSSEAGGAVNKLSPRSSPAGELSGAMTQSDNPDSTEEHESNQNMSDIPLAGTGPLRKERQINSAKRVPLKEVDVFK